MMPLPGRTLARPRMGPLDIRSIYGMPSASGWRTEPEYRYGNFNSPMTPEGRLPWEPLPHQPTDRSEEIWQNRSPSASELGLAFDESSESSQSSQSEDDYDYMSGDTHESDEDELDESSTYEFDSESYYSGSSSDCSDDTAVGTETVEVENTSIHRNGNMFPSSCFYNAIPSCLYTFLLNLQITPRTIQLTCIKGPWGGRSTA
ncbi:hypothetical protein ANO14919_065900 [Xylariales sp. No.14919]|nr:hypothetical protein ANO14919_065900 [Xylariales sp. No.14919]